MSDAVDCRVIEAATFEEAAAAVALTGADPYSIPRLAQKAFIRLVHLSGVDNRAANLIKQETLALGADAAVNSAVSRFVKGRSDVLVAATPKQYTLLLSKLALQPFGLKSWKEKIERSLARFEQESFSVRCGSRRLLLGRTPALMGIVNVTPDSFSDGGEWYRADRAVTRACALFEAGAAVIDIGGESTRPGARPVPVKEEAARVVPVIRAVRRRTKAFISVDTCKPEVARAALDCGADIINDVTGLCYADGKMARLAAEYRAGVVIMHMKGTPRTMQRNPVYRDVVEDIGGFFEERVAFAASMGLPFDGILLDPGIGFGKNAAHNLEILRRLREFSALGRPLVVGASRKSFIGAVTGRTIPQERVCGSIAAAVVAARNGARILRVHDVAETADALAVLSAVRDARSRRSGAER